MPVASQSECTWAPKLPLPPGLEIRNEVNLERRVNGVRRSPSWGGWCCQLLRLARPPRAVALQGSELCGLPGPSAQCLEAASLLGL